MLAVSPVISLENDPAPVPSAVWESEVVGPDVVLQQTPRIVISSPPESVIFPPDIALTDKRFEIAAVVRTGSVAALVVKDISFPYAVPALFVA